MDTFVGLIWLGIFILVYFFPAFVASRRGHHQVMAIFLFNLFLGWTFIGWVGALVWSVTAVKRLDRSGCVT